MFQNEASLTPICSVAACDIIMKHSQLVDMVRYVGDKGGGESKEKTESCQWNVSDSRIQLGGGRRRKSSCLVTSIMAPFV